MQNKTFTCTCGKKVDFQSESIGCYNVGEMRDKTGWLPIFLQEGGTVWLCVDCGNKAKELAIKISKLIGTNDFYFRSLVKE